MHMIYETAGMRIEKLRKLRGLSRKKLSRKCKVSEKFIYEIEKGRTGFSAATLYDIADTLGVCTDYILNGMKSERCMAKRSTDTQWLKLEDKEDFNDLQDLL